MGNATEYYLNRVACYIQGAYVSIHHTYVPDKDKPALMPGNACQDTRTIMGQAQFWAHMKDADVYLAMGAQEQHGGFRTEKSKLPIAIRKQHNIIAANCFYIDVDVDINPKKNCYRNVPSLNIAIEQFVANSGLPFPNLVVNSGRGGKHLYWILNEPIHPVDFTPVARALATAIVELNFKADAQCTSDICRLLRIPGTMNFKANPPAPVTIDSQIEQNYTLEDIATPLAQWIGKRPVIIEGGNLDADPEDADDLEAGIGNKSFQPADLELVAKECPFIANTLVNHGKDYREPLWFLCMGLAAHSTDPTGMAHTLSSGHVAYSQSETDEKLATAQRARQQDAKLGPPRCASFHQAGASECANCPHLPNNPSPVSFGFSNTGGGNGATPPNTGPIGGAPNQKDPDLPAGYYRGKDDFIYYNDSSKSAPVVALRHKIIRGSGYFEATPPWQFIFHTEQSGNESVIKFAYADAMDKLTLARNMANNGININHAEGYKFMVNFTQHLRSMDKLVVDIPPLGWHTRHGVVGFAYDRKFASSTETIKCQGLPADQGKYGGFGEAEPWKDLANIVLTPTRPDLAVMVASGFASPLMHFTGHNGVILGGWSRGSGIGKTTALSLAHSVWGSPSGMSGLDDTVNFVMAKASMLSCLPLCYDEIKTVEQTKNLSNLIHNLTRGIEKGRLNQKGEMKPTRTWETQITYASNASMAHAVSEMQKGTLAGLYRLFEFECMSNRPTIHSSGDIARMTKKLYANYGMIGRQYAEYLGQNHDSVQKFVVAEHEKYHAHFNATQEERYWTALFGTLMAGAQFANHIGVATFPIEEMEGFLLDEFARMRGEQSKSTADYSNMDTIIGELSNALNYYRARNTVVTDTMILTAGKPTAGMVHCLNDKIADVKKEAIHVHIGLNPLTLRISMIGLGQWCKQNNIPVGSLNAGLTQLLGAKSTTAKMASGTEYATAPMACWTIPVAGSPLENYVEWATTYAKP